MLTIVCLAVALVPVGFAAAAYAEGHATRHHFRNLANGERF